MPGSNTKTEESRFWKNKRGGEYLDMREREEQTDGENCIMISFTICYHRQISLVTACTCIASVGMDTRYDLDNTGF
jgi:hypothetical protein